jgi:hypothetical protein
MNEVLLAQEAEVFEFIKLGSVRALSLLVKHDELLSFWAKDPLELER